MTAPTFRVTAIELYERAVVLRIPFRFGAATVTRAPQAFVRAGIQLNDGCQAYGAAAEMMIPKWFDKSPKKSNSDNISDLRRSLSTAGNVYVAETRALTAFGHFAAHYAELIASGAKAQFNPLIANYGAAVIDRAILDAFCRALGVSFSTAIRANLAGINAELTLDLRGFDIDRFLASLTLPRTIAARHTVGMLDALVGGEASVRVDDLLPETLEDVIAAYGNRYFKLKLGGNARADVERLVRIAAVLDRLPAYAITLDGNEQYAERAAIAEFWRRVEATPALARLAAGTLYLEQPLPRSIAFDADVSELARRAPLLIDESDATLDAFLMAKAAGYTGVSSKSCKGIYKSLLNAARCRQWNAGDTPRYFLSGEDLTMQAGIAVQQDLALAALLGLRHVERNGHHYVNGFSGQGAGIQEQQHFLASQPGLYEASHGGVRLAIRDGVIDIASLDAPGFAVSAEPDWVALEPMGAVSTMAS
jgi:L-alanine-DL-glutamate epimerase-like enolase superfamily enzyme